MGEETTPETARERKEILVSNGLPEQDNSLDGPARARKIASRVDPTVRSQRIGAIVEMFKAEVWKPGETAWQLADAWRMKGESIENDASIAKLVIAVSVDKAEVIPRVWASMFALAETGERALAKAEAIFDQYAVPATDAPRVKPEQLMFLTTSIKNLTDIVERAMDRIARYAEMTPRAGASVNVNLLIDQSGAPRPELAALLEVVGRALTPYPEAARAVGEAIKEWRRSMSGGAKVLVEASASEGET
jgi:hypothetical protein